MQLPKAGLSLRDLAGLGDRSGAGEYSSQKKCKPAHCGLRVSMDDASWGSAVGKP